MQSVTLHSRTTHDGVLKLEVPIGTPDAEFEVVLVIQPAVSGGPKTQARLELLKKYNEYINDTPKPVEELRENLRRSLIEAGYDTPEKIVELTRDVRREMARERDQK